MVSRLRELAYGNGVLPALEMMVVEFGNLHYYSDITEWTAVLEHLQIVPARRQLVDDRIDIRLKTAGIQMLFRLMEKVERNIHKSPKHGV